MANNVIGEEFRDYVANQIMIRQKIHGSGVNNLRTNDQISYLNSKTAWIKLASGVSISEKKLKKINLPSSLKGSVLAQKNVLFGGTSIFTDDSLSPQLSDVGLSGYQHSNEWGIVPMPGIESMDVKTFGRGSLEKATVKLKAYSREQFDIIDVLYLRLGYTVVLEFGNSSFINNSGEFETVKNTFIDSKNGFFSKNNSSFRSMIDPLEDFRDQYDGNYDALAGKVSNFNWDFNPDGSYDITITIISMGDVIESLKSNVSPSKDALTFINETNQSVGENDQDFAPVSDNISSMLWIWQFINRAILENSSQTSVSITLNSGLANERKNFIGKICTSGQNEISGKVYNYYLYLGSSWPGVDSEDSTLFITKTNPADPEKEKSDIEDAIKNNLSTLNSYPRSRNIDKKFYKTYKTSRSTAERSNKGFGKETIYFVNTPEPKVYKQELKGIVVDNILKSSAKAKSCFVLRGKAGKDGEDPKNIFYLRFGTLLRFLQKNIIPAIKASNGNTPLFDIAFDNFTKHKMYSLPNHISLDPRVCLVRNDKFQKNSNSFARVLPQLLPFRSDDYAPKKYPNAAYLMNIYLNFDFIQSSINDNTDEVGNIGVFGFISSICDGLNKALGGINNLEPVIDKNDNLLKIIDSSPIPGVTSLSNNSYALELYGYNNNTSNFVRKVDLKTAITKEYATMITVGATAGGYVKGSEATAFSKWNEGLVDRFNRELINNLEEDANPDEAKDNYEESFLKQLSKCYGFTGVKLNSQGKDVSIDSKAIGKNLSIVTEYYKWLQNKNGKGNSIGFIPFKLSLTLDGISGMRIYDKLRIDSRFLPSNYGTELELIVTGISHKLSNNDWETSLETTVIPIAGTSLPAPPAPVVAEEEDDYEVTQGTEYSPSTTIVTDGWNWTQPGTRALGIAKGNVLQGYDLAPHHDSKVSDYLMDEKQKFGFWTRRIWRNATHPSKLMIVGDASANRIENGVKTYRPWIPSPVTGTVTFAGLYSVGTNGQRVSAIHIKSSTTGHSYRFLHGSDIQFSLGDQIKAGDYMYRQSDKGSAGSIHVHYEFPDDKVWLINEWIEKMITNDASYNHSPLPS